jgi:hypothetical protein
MASQHDKPFKRRAERSQPLPRLRSNEDAGVPGSVPVCPLSIPRQETSSFTNHRFPSDRIGMNRAFEVVVPEVLSKSNRTPVRPNNARLFASWQSGPETLSGLSQRKLRLELAASRGAQITEGKLREEIRDSAPRITNSSAREELNR